MDSTRQRIPSLFTNPVVLAVAGLFFFGALLARRHELAVLAVLVGALMGASRLWAGFAPKWITCGLSVDRFRVFPGETVKLRAEVENGKLLPVHLALSISSSDVVATAPGQPETLQTGALLWFQRAGFTWIFTALKRGIHQLTPPRLTAGDLLGFYSRNIVIDKLQRIVVFPRLVPLKPVRLSRRDLFGKPGGTGMLPDPLYIVGTRDYQARAPARHIHWKASARHLRVQEKVFEPSFREKMLFIVQVSGFITGRNGEAFERTLEVVAALSVLLQGDGYPVGLATNAACSGGGPVGGGPVGGGPVILPPAENARHLLMLMETLAGMKMESSGDIASSIRSMVPMGWGMSCLVFSAGLSSETADLLRSLKGRRVPAALVLCGGQAGVRTGEIDGVRIHKLTDFYDGGAF